MSSPERPAPAWQAQQILSPYQTLATKGWAEPCSHDTLVRCARQWLACACGWHHDTSRQGFIYLIEAAGIGRWKIGRTRNVPRRLGALRQQSPVPLLLHNVIVAQDAAATESLLHMLCHAPSDGVGWRVHGEWFYLSQGRVEELLSLAIATESTNSVLPALITYEGWPVFNEPALVHSACGRHAVVRELPVLEFPWFRLRRGEPPLRWDRFA